MKKIILLALSLSMVNAASSQVRDLMLKKAQQMANQKNQPAQQPQPATDSSSKTQPTQPAQENANPFGVSGGSKKDVQAEYKFTDNALIELQNYKKDGKPDGDPSKVRYHFSNQNYLGMEMTIEEKKGQKASHSFSVAEMDKNQMIMLSTSDGEKTGMVIKFDFSKAMKEANDSSANDWTVRKTGRTKVILGYTCEEWVAVNEKEGSKNEMWVAPSLSMNVGAASAAFAKGSKNSSTSTYFNGYPQGFTMEMIMTQKNGEKTTWKTLEVNPKKESSIKTGDYTFFGF